MKLDHFDKKNWSNFKFNGDIKTIKLFTYFKKYGEISKKSWTNWIEPDTI